MDILISERKMVPNVIDEAISALANKTLDRPEIFVPRLYLAKMQWLYELGQYDKATDEIVKFMNDGNKINAELLNNFLEVMRSGFSMGEIYGLDHA